MPLGGGFFIFTGSTLSTIILAIASIIIARLLDPSEYGLYSVVFIVPSLMLTFTGFGIGSALVKFTARYKSERKYRKISTLKSGILFNLIIGLAMLMLSLILADYLAVYLLKRQGIGQLLRLVSLVIVAQILISTSSNVFIGVDEAEKTALTSITQAIVKALVAPLLILLGLGVLGALIGHVLGYLVGSILGATLVLKIYKAYLQGTEDGSGLLTYLKQMIKYGIPLYCSSPVWRLLGQYQSIALAQFASNIEIGNYSIATMFSALIMFLSNPISASLFPAFSKLNLDSDHGDLKRLFQYSNRYALMLIVPASIFLAIASNDFIGVLYGSRYTLAPLYLAIYSTTFLYTGFTLVLNSFFNGIGRTDVSFKASLIQAVASIPLTIVLTYLYSIPGFIVSMLVSNIISIVYTYGTANSEYGMSFNLKSIVKIYLAALLSIAPAIVIMHFLSHEGILRLILMAFSFTLIYLTLIPALRALDEDDLDNLRTVFSRSRILSSLSEFVISYEGKLLKLFYSTSWA